MKREQNRLDAISLVDYSKGEERLNTVTHAAGLLLSAAIVWFCVKPSLEAADPMRIACSILYFIGTTVMFLTSALYHGVKRENAKRRLRLLDHCMIFFTVAGTATGCVPAVMDTVGLAPSLVLICVGWSGALVGLFLTLRDFEGTRGVQLALYIVTGLTCAVAGGGAYRHLAKGAFLALVTGSALLLFGTALYGIGKKRRYFHGVFHVFIDAGLLVYFLGISRYCY